MNLTLLGFLKAFVLFGIVVYLIFAVIVVKQVKIMNTTLKSELSSPISLSSYLHLAFAIGVFLFALFFL